MSEAVHPPIPAKMKEQEDSRTYNEVEVTLCRSVRGCFL